MHVTVDNLDELWRHIAQSGMLVKYEGVRDPNLFPWGATEVHLIDPAGVCWHFSE